MALRFRKVGEAGEYPAWVRALRGRCGSYVIKEHGWVSSSIEYVGESHTGRLYETLTRHFQRWTGRTSGPTFARASVEVAVVCTRADRAVPTQNALIRRLRPTLNVVGAAEEEVPF